MRDLSSIYLPIQIKIRQYKPLHSLTCNTFSVNKRYPIHFHCRRKLYAVPLSERKKYISGFLKKRQNNYKMEACYQSEMLKRGEDYKFK